VSDRRRLTRARVEWCDCGDCRDQTKSPFLSPAMRPIVTVESARPRDVNLRSPENARSAFPSAARLILRHTESRHLGLFNHRY